jgi:cellulose synthase/poly-beta-1,6-N-acetylglucosamine synthase-like glycosyltransferase
MMAVIYVLIGTYLLISCINLIMKLINPIDRPKRILSDNELPHIAVLVAARNEELHIEKCLSSLVKQNYPIDKISIWVGNDQSTDNTANIVNEFASQYAHINQLHVTTQLGKAKGKANVLAQLAHQTQAEYLLITDADIETQPNWARTLVSFFDEKVGIVSGTTIVGEKGLWHKMQQTDWLYFMGLLLTFDKLGLKSTAVGNNMAISRKAYLSTGGYENIDFSVTEDFKLFAETRKQGWQTINMLHDEAVNTSAPAGDVTTLLNQRKRWLSGGKELPVYWWIIFLIFGLFMPFVFILCFIDIKLAVFAFLFKWIIQSFTLYAQSNTLKLHTTFIHLFVYEFYLMLTTLASGLFFIIPIKLNWKNRYY